MRTVIEDLAEQVEIAALQKEIGPLNASETERVRRNVEERVRAKQSKYPILDAIATATKGALRPGPFWDWRQEDPPIAEKLRATIDEVATASDKHYLHEADNYFAAARSLEATQSLSDAATCSIAAIAVRNRWPHDGVDGIHEAITILATGLSPETAGAIHQMMSSALTKARTSSAPSPPRWNNSTQFGWA